MAYGGDDDTNNTYRPNSTSGTNGYTHPTPVPNGSNGGAGSGGGFNGTGAVSVVIASGGGGGFGGDSYTHPTWSSTTFYKGGQSGINKIPEPSGRQSGPFVNTDPPSRIWIPQEPTIAGRGTKTINNEVPSSSKIFKVVDINPEIYKTHRPRFQYSWVGIKLDTIHSWKWI